PEQPVAVPKAGAAKSQRRPPPPARKASADAPTEVTSAPTTPIPRAGMTIPAEKKKRSNVGMVVGALVLVAAGVSGYLAFGRKSAAGPPPVATPVETVRVANPPPPPPPPPAPPAARRGNDNRRQAPPPPAPQAAAEGLITV